MAGLTLSRARRILSAGFAKARATGLKPLAILVLDAGGHPLAFERQDGASAMRFAVAHGKAFGALGMGLGSRALMRRAESQPSFVAAVGAAFGGALVPVPGGVLVRARTGLLLGAVGVTGDSSDNDEAVAIAGIEAARLVADPG